MTRFQRFTDTAIVEARGAKSPVDPRRAYAAFVEPEHQAHGRVEPVATIFLTGRECPFRCLMCDLWQHTLAGPTQAGDLPTQLDHALAALPPARHLKLYNGANFFDRKAVPLADYEALAERASGFDSVVVENHPRLVGPDVRRFQSLLPGRLEVAMGLETVHPQVLPALNKRMDLKDYRRAVHLLRDADIQVRAFILLRPPYLSEAEGITWALRSIKWAFEVGVSVCSVVPTRAGNGLMEQLAEAGRFAPPSLASMEHVLEAGLAMGQGRVFMDLWDADRFPACTVCQSQRIDRLRTMNLTQQPQPPIPCEHCGGEGR